ncbi:helix-turn-helix domain-containing protein [Serratia marcescens]|uniref:helix-turn-helix domain-containing protein n=1 Tax=Serratia marcescens TaxID=615 RepID=UPI000E3BCEA3|nr:helix-turn-helix transcriptional regulator [Serratia marcescens]RFS94874.1 transcriptional regulator [Serratia marcescens]
MLHKALRIIRQYHGESIAGLSKTLNIPKEKISQLESGALLPPVDILERYSSHFDIPISSLIFFSESLGTQGRLSKRLRLNLAGKILDVLAWINNRNEKAH